MASSKRAWLLGSLSWTGCTGNLGAPQGPGGESPGASVSEGTSERDGPSSLGSSEQALGRTGPRRLSNVECAFRRPLSSDEKTALRAAYSRARALGESELNALLILYGGAMHGSDHGARPLPMASLGGGRAGIRGDQHVDFSGMASGRPLRDLYFTILNGYYGLNVASFGDSLSGQNSLISEILT